MEQRQTNDQMRTIDRRTVLQSISAAGLFNLAGCTASILESTDDKTINWLAPPEGGDAYALCLEFKEIIEEFIGYEISIQTTEEEDVEVASAVICENLRDNDDSEFGICRNDVAHFANTGTGLQTFENNQADNLRGCATLYPEAICIITQSDADIQSIADLKGARINTGASNSATRANAHLILGSIGISARDFTEQNNTYTDLASEFRSGNVDAAFVIKDWPAEIVGELMEYSDLSLLSLDRDEQNKIMETSGWYVEEVIPGGTYTGIDEDISTVACKLMIVTRDRTDEKIVSDVTTTIFENTDQIETKREFISSETATEGMSIEPNSVAKEVIEGTAAEDEESEPDDTDDTDGTDDTDESDDADEPDESDDTDYPDDTDESEEPDDTDDTDYPDDTDGTDDTEGADYPDDTDESEEPDDTEGTDYPDDTDESEEPDEPDDTDDTDYPDEPDESEEPDDTNGPDGSDEPDGEESDPGSEEPEEGN